MTDIDTAAVRRWYDRYIAALNAHEFDGRDEFIKDTTTTVSRRRGMTSSLIRRAMWSPSLTSTGNCTRCSSTETASPPD
jgi:hypothetical protein